MIASLINFLLRPFGYQIYRKGTAPEPDPAAVEDTSDGPMIVDLAGNMQDVVDRLKEAGCADVSIVSRDVVNGRPHITIRTKSTDPAAVRSKLKL